MEAEEAAPGAALAPFEYDMVLVARWGEIECGCDEGQARRRRERKEGLFEKNLLAIAQVRPHGTAPHPTFGQLALTRRLGAEIDTVRKE